MKDRVLFVGGPWHGEMKEVRIESFIVVPDMDEDRRLRHIDYKRERWRDPDDSIFTVYVWGGWS